MKAIVTKGKFAGHRVPLCMHVSGSETHRNKGIMNFFFTLVLACMLFQQNADKRHQKYLTLLT
jgi:hypothetical protein